MGVTLPRSWGWKATGARQSHGGGSLVLACRVGGATRTRDAGGGGVHTHPRTTSTATAAAAAATHWRGLVIGPVRPYVQLERSVARWYRLAARSG